ncbi:MAG: hypothetical protein JO112_14430, partial [Planctomycetes bacterium]|nr:hypothetical protein [Planctomycetota bacterium]
MIEMDFQSQSQLVDRIAKDMDGPHPSCWDAILPPGFAEERFSEQLERRLRGLVCQPRVAVRGADHTNPSIRAFIQALHWQWTETPSPPNPLHRSADLYFDMLFGLPELRSSKRPLILVLKRFHKVLDNLDKWVLGKLRTEEQARRLHTIVITPLPLSSLKKRWESHKHYFSTSDYGDSRHALVTAEAPNPVEVIRACQDLSIPDAVADYARKLTGGYPEPLAAVLEWWDKQGRPELVPRTRGEMLDVARSQFATFVEWLDPLEDGQYRDQVINLYHQVNPEEARDAFHNHPWREVVLEEDGLRAEALGAAALCAALDGTVDRKMSQSFWFEVTERARRLYERGQYEAALRVLGSTGPDRLRPHDRVLQAHA